MKTVAPATTKGHLKPPRERVRGGKKMGKESTGTWNRKTQEEGEKEEIKKRPKQEIVSVSTKAL